MRPARLLLLALPILMAWSVAAPGAASAQLVPERVYYGIDRAIPMVVRGVEENSPAAPAPTDEPASPVAAPSAAAVELDEPGTWRSVESAPCRGGQIDLAAMFPSLWKREQPRLLYAQLVVGGRKVGPPVVLQPLVSPAYAAKLDRTGTPMFPAAKEQPRVYSGLRAYVDQNVAIQTSKGRILIALRPDAAPNTCWRFRELVAGGLYTDVLVHRIASLAGRPEPDIVQTGDPNGTGQGGAGELLDIEPSTLPHAFGVVSMARFADPNSASSQFMIALNREGTAYLDRRYTAFGEVIAGAEVLRAIAASPVNAGNRPLDPPVIHEARLIDAAPAGEGPGPEADPLKKPGR